MSGFFDLGIGFDPFAEAPARGPKTLTCDNCGRSQACNSPKHISGLGKRKILIIAEAQSPKDDALGKFMRGSGGALFWGLDEHGINIERDCWLTYAQGCRFDVSPKGLPGGCIGRIQSLIRELRPSVIIPMGISAMQAVLGDRAAGRIKSVKPSDYFGERIPDQDFMAWICPTWSPKFISQDERDPIKPKRFVGHMTAAFALAGVPVPVQSDVVHTTMDPDEAEAWLIAARTRKEALAIDAETTGIKSHADGHRIVSMAIATSEEAWAFPWFSDHPGFLRAFRNLMRSPSVGKIAHKADFDFNWIYDRGHGAGLGAYWPQNLDWDTCLAAHALSNDGPTGLKFHTYTRLGVIGYDEDADQYINAASEEESRSGANAKNRMAEAPLSVTLRYNGLDALYTKRLSDIQKAEFAKLPPALESGLRWYQDASITLAKCHQEGMQLDESRFADTYADLTVRLDECLRDLRKFEEYKKWPGPGSLNVGSDPQLSKLLYSVLGYTKPAKSPTGAEALLDIGTPFVDKILEIRKIQKMRDTYLAQFKRESVGGVIRPFFNLHRVKTFRSSSDSPNFQNLPKRDKLAKKAIRTLIRPRPGNRIIEYDYKSVEVCISACYHKDPSMITYIEDPRTDMHRDTAQDLFFRTVETFLKEERQLAKNQCVFPAFYGSSAKVIAPALWKGMGDATRAHVAAQGVKTERDWLAHVSDFEQKFWGERFQVYAEWKRRTWKRYQRTGYLDLYTGFRVSGVMGFTDATNYQIQGSAFHCLLWTLDQVFDKIREISGRSAIIGQIHDAMVGDIHPDDEEEVDRIIKLYGTQLIREHWPWIIVPLTIEKERSAIDGDWSEMEGCGNL